MFSMTYLVEWSITNSELFDYFAWYAFLPQCELPVFKTGVLTLLIFLSVWRLRASFPFQEKQIKGFFQFKT